ncbi:hypothetical protein LDL08_21060 [Nonomuraea glycinis]|nr:hypothetical protein [Nonomuraea glycinis]MCA2178683.1 hypothetical protein [Nonomuraea glycinis]
MRAGVALLLVLAVGVAWASRDEEEVPQRPAELPVVPHLDPVKDVWPDVVSVVPAERKDGMWLWPIGALGGDELLLMTREHRPEFISFNTRTKKQRVFAQAPERAACGGCFEVQATTLGASHVALLVKGYASGASYGGQRHYELWAMPRTGGPMHMVSRLPLGVQAEEAYVYGFQIAGEHAVWWGYDGDVWRVPLSGGEPEQLLPGRRLRVSSWPWAYDQYERSVVNVETGQEIEVAAADDLDHRLACGPAWCVGEDRQELWKVTQATVLRVDGSERTTVPGDALLMRPPIRDRLALLGVPTVDGDDSIPRTWGAGGLGHVAQIYDRCTHQSALLGSYALTKAEMPWGEIKIGAWTQNGPLVFWRTRDRLVVVDLARIGGSSCST